MGGASSLSIGSKVCLIIPKDTAAVGDASGRVHEHIAPPVAVSLQSGRTVQLLSDLRYDITTGEPNDFLLLQHQQCKTNLATNSDYV